MRKVSIIALLAGALVGMPATSAATPAAGPPVATASHSCSSGYTHGIIGGEHKCLRNGQYCAVSSKRKYRRFGFLCRRDSSGVFRLYS